MKSGPLAGLLLWSRVLGETPKPSPCRRSRWLCWFGEREVAEQGGVVGWSFSAAFGVVDPGGGRTGGERLVGCQVIQAHPEVAAVADPVVPPGEASGSRSPDGDVDVDEAGVVEPLQSGSFGWRDMGVSAER